MKKILNLKRVHIVRAVCPRSAERLLADDKIAETVELYMSNDTYGDYGTLLLKGSVVVHSNDFAVNIPIFI